MRGLILSACLLLMVCTVALSAETITKTSVTAATSGPHPAFDANAGVNNFSVGAAYVLGSYVGYARINFLSLYLAPGNGSYVTTVGVEGRLTDTGAGGRLHVQEAFPVKGVTVVLGGYGGSDYGAWGRVSYQKFTVLAGRYDNFASRGGIHYTIPGGGQVGLGWSRLIGPYAAYTHTFTFR